MSATGAQADVASVLHKRDHARIIPALSTVDTSETRAAPSSALRTRDRACARQNDAFPAFLP